MKGMCQVTIDDRIKILKNSISNRAAAMRSKIKKQGFKFQPFSDKQKKVLTWWCPASPVKDADGIIADGAIRSGKTLSMSLSYILWAMETFNGQNFIMAGKTVGSFRRNVLFWLKQMLASRGYQLLEKRADNLFIVTKGKVTNYFYIFGGKDERSQDLVQGITAAGAFFDEVALMPESFVNQATGRLSVTGSKMWFNCNPASPQHWFKVNWIDKLRCSLPVEKIEEMESGGKKPKDLIYLHFTMDDNLSLAEDIKKRYRSMYVGVFFKRYIEGLWCVAEGLVYSMFDSEVDGKHVKSDHMSGVMEWVVSVDYGTVNPFAAGLWAFDGQHAQKEYEYYYDSRETGVRRDDETHYQELCKLIGNRRVEFIIVDPSAASFIECINKHGTYIAKGAVNDVLDGIRVQTTFLNKGIISYYKDCKATISEYGLYSWDMENVEDAVIKEFDHALDSDRYMCYTFLRTRLRWQY